VLEEIWPRSEDQPEEVGLQVGVALISWPVPAMPYGRPIPATRGRLARHETATDGPVPIGRRYLEPELQAWRWPVRSRGR